MDLSTMYDVPKMGGSYVPFTYRYEHFKSHEYDPLKHTNATRTGQEKIFQINPDRPQTVEQTLCQGYFAVPHSHEPAAAMITDKTHTSWMGLDDVIGQIKGRHEIYERNMYELELAKCSALNVFFEHERQNGNLASDRVYYSLNKNIARIYERQMQERVKLWQDTSKLRRELPDVAQTYLSAMRKSDIFKDTGDDTK